MSFLRVMSALLMGTVYNGKRTRAGNGNRTVGEDQRITHNGW